ncbi:MAG: pyruvate kinase [Lachnospiraceae bacterium]|nr:pyruvate kinase [Lachnospiraceae bacterium]
MRKTKIVATLGPATDNAETIKALIEAGMDVARFNFSHGTHDELKERVALVRSVCEETGATVALLADTKGPEVRLGTFEGGRAELIEDSIFTLTAEKVEGTATKASISYEGLFKDIKSGTRILLDDGLIELIAEHVSSNSVTTRVINGGFVSNKKSVNVPGVSLNIPFISGKDRADLRLITELGFHFIAASFVRSDEDIRLIKEELRRMGGERINIIAKIENAEGVDNTDAILAVADGLMVARGDLGVELEFVDLPAIQKELIKKAYRQGKNVITATQMLESMITKPRPTRAEASDVANAIYDGTSAIMLSAETSVGKYPVEAVKTMARIATRTESNIDFKKRFITSSYKPEPSVTNAISHATVTTAHDLEAAAILVVSKSGDTSRNVSKFRPQCPIIGGTPDDLVKHQLQLAWGVTPVLTKEEVTSADMITGAINASLAGKNISEGDLIIITAGIPVGQSGTTNLIKVHEVGEKLAVF